MTYHACENRLVPLFARLVCVLWPTVVLLLARPAVGDEQGNALAERAVARLQQNYGSLRSGFLLFRLTTLQPFWGDSDRELVEVRDIARKALLAGGDLGRISAWKANAEGRARSANRTDTKVVAYALDSERIARWEIGWSELTGGADLSAYFWDRRLSREMFYTSTPQPGASRDSESLSISRAEVPFFRRRGGRLVNFGDCTRFGFLPPEAFANRAVKPGPASAADAHGRVLLEFLPLSGAPSGCARAEVLVDATKGFAVLWERWYTLKGALVRQYLNSQFVRIGSYWFPMKGVRTRYGKKDGQPFVFEDQYDFVHVELNCVPPSDLFALKPCFGLSVFDNRWRPSVNYGLWGSLPPSPVGLEEIARPDR